MTIEVTGGTVVIDDCDAEILRRHKWHINDSGYAVWRGEVDGVKKTVRMHRLIMDTPEGMVTDHINHDRADNRRSNLRVCTQSDNMRNKRFQGRGYWYHGQNGNWVVEVNGKHIGVFDTEELAKKWAALARAGVHYTKPERKRCKYGHSLNDAYDYGEGKRCKKCQSIRSKQYYERKTKYSMDGNYDKETRKP